jgi:hypothetical protein
MTVDPTDPETLDEAENTEDTEDTEFDVEAPEADTAEQRAELSSRRDEPLTGGDPDRGNEADIAEQARVVELDEDDYR